MNKREVYTKAMNDFNECMRGIENTMYIVREFKQYTKKCNDYDMFGDCCIVVSELKSIKETLDEIGDMIHDMLMWSNIDLERC